MVTTVPHLGEVWLRQSEAWLVRVVKVEANDQHQRSRYKVWWTTVSQLGPQNHGQCLEEFWLSQHTYVGADAHDLWPSTDPRYTASAARPACWSWKLPRPSSPPPASPHRADALAYLSAWHRGRCAICGRRGHPLVLDHDHLEERARGFLCGFCNTREGAAPDYDLAIFVAYRAHHAADLLGIDYAVKNRNRVSQPVERLLGRQGYERSLLNPRYREVLLDLCGVPPARRSCWGPFRREIYQGEGCSPSERRRRAIWDDRRVRFP